MENISVLGIEVTIQRKHNKRMYLRVKAPLAEVFVTAPFKVSTRTITHFVESNIEWIRKKQQCVLTTKSAIDPNEWDDQIKKECRNHLEKVIPFYIKKWEKIMNVSVTTVTIRLMKSRWGSCNIVRKKITLNIALAKKDPECLEYIIVHEMVHFFEKGHNQKFYSLMDHFLPGWENTREKLKNAR